MKISTKAMLYSIIVFPGAGYFVLKQKRRGFIALVATLGLFFTLVYEAIYKAQILAEAMVRDILNSGQIPFDIFYILELREKIETVPGYFPAWFVTLATILLVAIWLVSIIDTYRLGKKVADEPTINT